MDMFEKVTRRRWSGSGLVLLAGLLLLLGLPLMHWGGHHHPLSDQPRVDLCARLPHWSALPTDAVMVRQPANNPGTGICEWHDANGGQLLAVMIETTRGASRDGAADLERMFETWVKEVRMSGAQDMQEIGAGPWQRAVSYRMGPDRQFLIQDEGVMLSFIARIDDAPALALYARQCAQVLREPATSAVSSSGAASPPR